MIELRAIRGKTGVLLGNLLRERGVAGRPATAVVCYGSGYNGALPCLNARAGSFNKLRELQIMAEAGVSVPPHSTDAGQLRFPVLGRKLHHTRAKDIVTILAPDRDFELRDGESDFYTSYVPRQAEYRVWSYRRQCLAVYEKSRVNQTERNGIAWNWHNGFSFLFYHNAPEELKNLGSRAVDCLDLDFGASDIVLGTDGRFYVLEVNTAPGVEDLRQGIVSLADKISRWHSLGYPVKNGRR